MRIIFSILFIRLLLLLVALASLSVCCFGQQDLTVPSTTLTSGTTLYQAPNSISNTASFTVQGAASVTFKAGNFIHLVPGFRATAGSAGVTFHAVIDPSVQSAPISIISQPPAASSPSKEYIHFGGQTIVIENPH